MVVARGVFLILFSLMLWSVSAHADVVGSLSVSAELAPDGVQTEAQKMNIDLRTNLQLNVTVSGMTLGLDSLFGTMGLEEVLLSLNTNLGALRISDEFFFSIPYYLEFPPGPFGLSGQLIHPTVDGNGNVNGLGFVQKKIVSEVNIAGVTLTNTALFQDVDFPSVFDTFNPVYNLDQVDNIVGNQTPTFGFGDVLEISGQTVSGITVTGATYICAREFGDFFKSGPLEFNVNPACTAQFGQTGITPLEGGAKTPLLFELETLFIENVEIGGVNLDAQVFFRPNVPLLVGLFSDFTVLDMLHVSTFTILQNLTQLQQTQVVISTLDLNELDETEQLITNGVEILMLDTDGDLVPEQTAAILGLILNPNQNPAYLLVQMNFDAAANGLTNSGGLTNVFVQLSIERGPMVFNTSTFLSDFVLNNGQPGSVGWDSTTFSLSFEPEDSDMLFSVGANFNSFGPPIFNLEFELDFGLGFEENNFGFG